MKKILFGFILGTAVTATATFSINHLALAQIVKYASVKGAQVTAALCFLQQGRDPKAVCIAHQLNEKEFNYQMDHVDNETQKATRDMVRNFREREFAAAKFECKLDD